MIPDGYTYNGDMLFPGLVTELNNFVTKDQKYLMPSNPE